MSQQNTRMFQYCFDPAATSLAGQGSIMTRDSCFFKEGPVGYGYDLMQTRTIPRMGDGGHSGITQAVELDTDLDTARIRRACPRPS
jgi:hypothetical protein